MSNEAVKKKILIAVGDLNVPLDRHLSKHRVNAVCAAAKFLRNRLLREHNRVLENLEMMRQEQLFDGEENQNSVEVRGTSRDEFLLISELMVVEKLALPLLLAHGLNFSSNLLPQLLKLITAMLLPIPRFSSQETLQKDKLGKLRQRCGTDEFLSFLVQVVAPIAEKRKIGDAQREDFVLLEVVLKLLSLLLHDVSQNVIGSFSRNHGMEMLIVVLNQNFAKSLEKRRKEADSKKSEEEEVQIPDQLNKNDSLNGNSEAPATTIEKETNELESTEQHSLTSLETDSDNSENDLVVDVAAESEAQITAQFEQQINSLFEGEEQLWKWNKLIVSCIASVLHAAPADELARLNTLLQKSGGTTVNISVQHNKESLEACRKEREKWQRIARSRSGPMASNALLVRREERQTPGTSFISPVGTVSTLLGSRQKDSLEPLRVMDSRKRGRFVKGMFEESIPKCTLHIQAQLELGKQSQTFFLYGFEPLHSMVWKRLQESMQSLQEAVKEYSETKSGYMQSGEAMDISTPFTASMFESLGSILNYMSICGSFLRYTREMVRLLSEASSTTSRSSATLNSTPLILQKLWRSLSTIISLDHLTQAFSVLQLYLKCRDVGRRTDMSTVIQFTSEILLSIQLLLEGKIVDDAAVQTAAHALASSVLYNNDTISCLFEVLGLGTNFTMPIQQARTLLIFTFSILELVEQCSFQGTLLVSKGKKKKKANPQSELDKEPVVLNAENPEESARLSTPSEGKADDIDASELNTPRESSALRHEEENPEAGDKENEVGSSRAGSEAPSFSSAYTATSTVEIEKEVAVNVILQRLGTPKYIWLLVTVLRHWRTNDADINLALVYIMRAMMREGVTSSFFHLPFLLSIREVLLHGHTTHRPLYQLCDELAYEFFNPSFARALDAQVRPEERHLLTGAQSYLGFEVALRCSRCLFALGSVEYSILEEKGMSPHQLSSISIPLKTDDVAPERDLSVKECDSTESTGLQSSPRRKVFREEATMREALPDTTLLAEPEPISIDAVS